jgi:uncharacterized protein YbbC (DUF1343 family)
MSRAGAEVLPGVEVLVKEQSGLLKGKRVGILTNPTGVDRQLVSTIDLVRDLPGVNVVRLFSPEHGLRGLAYAGEEVDNFLDPISGLPVVSLHGATKMPDRAMLEDLDAIVYDIQDTGHRTYTYVSTLTNLMVACEEVGVEVVVLDRPVPIGGDKVGGPVLDVDLYSFIGIHNVPQVYGLTPGEWARLIQAERTPKVGLTVVPMKGWRRGMVYGDLDWPWVAPSEHIPHWESSFFYAMTGTLGELGIISEGVGTSAPFQRVGAPWLNGADLANRLNAAGLAGVKFRPVAFRPRYFHYEGEVCEGVQIHLLDPHACNPAEVCWVLLKTLREMLPERNPFRADESNPYKMFTWALGDSRLAQALDSGGLSGTKAYIEAEVAAYLPRREAVLLYPE